MPAGPAAALDPLSATSLTALRELMRRAGPRWSADAAQEIAAGACDPRPAADIDAHPGGADIRRALAEAQSVAALTRGARTTWSRGRGTTRGVVVDGGCLQDPRFRARGIGLHTRGVLGALQSLRGAHRVRLLLDPRGEDPPAEVLDLADDVAWSPLRAHGDGCDVFLNPAPMTGDIGRAFPFLASPTPCVAVVYDFIPLDLADVYLDTPAAEIAYRARLAALSTYDAALAISDDTAERVRDMFPDVQTASTGVSDPLPAPGDAPHRPHTVLAPSGPDPRKGLAQAIDAFARAAGPGDVLEITGIAPGPFRDALEGRLPGGDGAARVVWRAPMSPQELSDAYATADAVIVPSAAEGFSMPVVEAARRGTPVVASDIPAHRELLPPGWWLCPRDDVGAFADALRRARADRAGVSAAQAVRASERAEPSRVAARVVAPLRSLLDRPAPRPATPRTGGRARVALVSPLPPARSGIADYTAAVVPALRRLCDVDLVNATADPAPLADFTVADDAYRRLACGGYDRILYVMGNSHFHIIPLEMLETLGGSVLTHDTRLSEFHHVMHRGPEAARLVAGDRDVSDDDVRALLSDPQSIGRSGYEDIARLADPLLVHFDALADTVERESGVRPGVVPFAVYNAPGVDPMDDGHYRRARRLLGIAPDDVHVLLYGAVDSRTKGFDLAVAAMGWLRRWGVPARLSVVGGGPPGEVIHLMDVAADAGVADIVTFEGLALGHEVQLWLQAADVAVQTRTSDLFGVSGAVVDGVALGLPTVTSRVIHRNHELPSYCVGLHPEASPMLIADAVAGLAHVRRESMARIEPERRAYVRDHSPAVHAAALVDALGLT